MNKAILVLLIIVSAFGIAFAQVESTPEQNTQEPGWDNVVNEVNGQVEKDPDELGAEAPLETQQEVAPPAQMISPENNSSATTITNENSGLASNVDPKNFTDTVSLQGLNKITARTSKLEVKLGDSIKFGNLKITLHSCWKSPPEEDTENKALLEMWEEIPGEPRRKIFSGWMFSSSPLISAPEHPVYDITLLGCTGGVAPLPKAPAVEPEKK